MADETSPVCHFPYIQPSQAQKHVTHNEALAMLDVLVQLAVLDRDLATPPGAAADGARYIVPASATGDWTGQTGKIAYRRDGTWEFMSPAPGWVAWVVDETLAVYWTGTAWSPVNGTIAALQNLSLLGIGTTADATNPFSAKLNKALWAAKTAAEGGDGDLRFTMNKEAATDVASILLQRGFSGRAEVGLIGDDRFTVKVSGNGTDWTKALSVGPGGKISLSSRFMLRPDISRRNYVASMPWLSSASAADNDWRGICWSPELGLFCTVGVTGTGNRVMTSPDGVTWTIRSSPSNDWRSVCWSPELGLFCAVGQTGTGNRVMTSPDGITWTSRSTPVDNSWVSVCWSPELCLFCAVGFDGSGNRVMTSPDGIAWTARTSAADNGWLGVCWAPDLGLFCAVASSGTGNRIMTSPDGIAWTTRTSAADNSWYDLCWASELGMFCSAGFSGTGNRVMTSVQASGVSSGLRRRGHPAFQTIATDAAITLTPLIDASQLRHTGTLTANRAVSLATVNAAQGDQFVITRSGGGAFNLTVGTGPLKSLATGTWCRVAFDGSAWVLAEYGAL